MQESDVEQSDSEHRSLVQCSYTTVYGSTGRTEAGLQTTSMSTTPSQVMNGVPQSLATNTRPGHIFCDVCYFTKPTDEFTSFSNCGHAFCTECVFRVFERSVIQSRVDLQCLQCTEQVTDEEIKSILTPRLYQKYLEFSLKHYLATVRNVRYCPSPDCPYACIDSTENGMPAINHFVCAREECHKEYCYQCKCPWHPDKTCQQAREEVALTMPEAAAPIPEETLRTLKAKQCPFCYATVEKLDDGSCNQVECINCRGSFCWLCGKSVTEMHYLRCVYNYGDCIYSLSTLNIGGYHVSVTHSRSLVQSQAESFVFIYFVEMI